jgi:hypothetical protein
MQKIKDFIKNVSLKTVVDNADPFVEDEAFFRSEVLRGFESLMLLMNKHKNKPALIMAHGPSLLDIKKEEYSSFLKITCNDFQKLGHGPSKPFFDDKFKPDFWCGANSLEHLRPSTSICVANNIPCFVTIPKKSEFEEYLNYFKDDKELILPWFWEHQMFQRMLARKYNVKSIYTRCNTVTNHMIALALWFGCNPIHVAGFDMSYVSAVEETGMTHAGYNDDKMVLTALDDPQERRQAIGDLRYMCKIAYKEGIEIHNLSFEKNKLPYNLSFRG